MSINLGLARIRQLVTRLHDPQLAYKTVHIAGTNGKGSVGAMIAHTLKLAGLRTGLYTSPHLMHRWDCIAIDGRPISFVDFEKSRRKVAEPDVSPFEELTATAFVAFRAAKVDIAVIETGMGGRLDATNVVSPLLSIITRIGIDHTAFLGTTLEAITAEKGGIIKPDAPVVVSGEQDSPVVFEVLQQILDKVTPGTQLTVAPMVEGDFRDANASTARTALKQLASIYPQLTDELIEQGIASTSWRGRVEKLDLSLLGGSAETILDGAHNAQSVAALSKSLGPSRPSATFIFAMTAGKEAGMFKPLLKDGDRVLAVEFAPVDGMPWVEPSSSADLAQALDGVDYGQDVAGAIRAAQGPLYICGSLYLIGQVHRLLEAAQVEDEARPGLSHGAYDAAQVEAWASAYWSALPPASPSSVQVSKRFLLPPPNVTGSLHIGHALTVAIQDAYVRFYRGQGERVEWVPGTDHAGIATQTVVAKSLAKQGIDAASLSPTDLITAIWQYKEAFGNKITNQIQRLGADLDWQSEYFTLDEERSEAVVEAFGKLWQDGLIRRDLRMVNWSTKLQSVISDIEVDTLSIDKPTKMQGADFGYLWTVAYKLEDGPDLITVKTTRPETVPGDRGIAVHPDDERFAALVGKRARHPLLPDVWLPIVADTMVDPSFGTGAVKLTPAHDVNDYAASLRHGIEQVVLFDERGNFLPDCGLAELVGRDRFAARERVVELLKEAGALHHVEPHVLRLGVCSRTGSIIEPRLMPQWFISMQPLADRVLSQDTIKMSERTKREWKRWLGEVQDWCVSRQLVWGHRIPLYRAHDSEEWVFARSPEEASKLVGGRPVVQDPDVLDTWFSSGLLPLSAFGWPRQDAASIAPLHFIESGPDILFFWLARMAMLCTHLSGKAPFEEILLHPIVRDAQGRKMSKSLGNVLDPLHLIDGCSLPRLQGELKQGNLSSTEVTRASKELAKNYPQGIQAEGTDALRFALLDSTVQEATLNLDIRSVKAGRYLCTKLWNVIKFVDFYEQETKTISAEGASSDRLLDDWIMQRFSYLQQTIEDAFAERSLFKVTTNLRQFVVDDLCDTYLEFLKHNLQRLSTVKARRARLQTLRKIADALCLALRPVMPFLAEALWHKLGHASSVTCQVTSRLHSSAHGDCEAQVDVLCQLLRALRAVDNIRGAKVFIQMADPEAAALVARYANALAQLAHVDVVRTLDKLASAEQIVPFPGVTLHIQCTSEQAQGTLSATEREQTVKRLDYVNKQHDKLAARLEDSIHRAKVPPNVLAKDEARLEALAVQRAALQKNLVCVTSNGCQLSVETSEELAVGARSRETCK